MREVNDLGVWDQSSMSKRHALDLMMLASKMSRLTGRTKTLVQQSSDVGQMIEQHRREKVDQGRADQDLTGL